MTTTVRWRKYAETDYEAEISDHDAELLAEGNTDVLAEYEDGNVEVDYSVTEREVHP